MFNRSNQMIRGIFNGKNAASFAAAIVLAAAQNGRCDSLINGSFETGDFSGWNVSNPVGVSQYYPFSIEAAGSAGVVSSFGPYLGMSSAATPADGDYFAVIGSAGNNNFGNYTATYDITAAQTVTLSAGETVSGDALFYNGDYEPQDTAFVKILNGNSVVATPWSDTSGMSTYRTATPWELWSWQAPSSGSYTLEIGVQTQGDDDFASYGMFDNLQVTPGTLGSSPVPEPSALGLACLGATGLFAGRRWLKK